MTDLKWKITEDNRTTCGTAARQIIDRLFTGEFPQGAPVRESKLAKELNISRNVMREALNLIVGMGILEYVPYCGYRTKSFTMRDALEWYEIRESVEPIACRRLARQRPRKIIDRLEALLHRQRQAFADGNFLPAFQLDGDFHLELISSCGNRLFSGLADSGFIAIAFLFKNRMLAVQRDGHSIFSDADADGTLSAHTLILDAIKTGDLLSAETQARIHAGIQVRNLERLIERDREGATAPLSLPDLLAANRSRLQ